MKLPDVLHEQDGEIRVKGSRISLFHIVHAYNELWMSPEAMVFHYDTLSLREIRQVIEFYHANRAEVDEYMDRFRKICDQRRAEGKKLDVDGLRRRFEAMKSQQTTVAEKSGSVSTPGEIQPTQR